jgi:ABC-type lipoprotein release transport system permease subunit
MKIFLAIAWRNIMRNKKRSFITAFAIAFGLIALIFMWSLIDGIYPAMIDNMTSVYMGHVEISRPEYVEQQKLEYAISDEEPVLKAIRENPDIAAWSPRLSVFGLLTYADHSQGIAVVGIDPEKEANFGQLANFVKEGRFIADTDIGGAVIGATLAKNLDVRLGEKVFFLTQGPRSELAYTNLTVVGILRSNVPEIDGGMVLMRRADLIAPEMMDMKAGFTTVAVRMKSHEVMDQATIALNAALPEGVRARTWKEMVPWFEQAIEMDNAFGYLLVFIMMVVVVAGILNTVLMSVMERTREFGIMRALGTKKRQVFLMVTIEAIVLGAIGLITGVIVGIGCVLIAGQTGINLYGSLDPEILGEFYIDPVVYPLLNLEHLLVTCIAVMVMVLIVSLYPARRAARLAPITAIKTLG